MHRRHVVVLVLVALLAVTVLTVGPGRVWDRLTLRTIEGHYEDGSLAYRHRARLWSKRPVGLKVMWHRNGHRAAEWDPAGVILQQGYQHVARGQEKAWDEGGVLRTLLVFRDGERTGIESGYTTRSGGTGRLYKNELMEQNRYVRGRRVERRNLPPWFTEEEILLSVEGAAE